MQTSDEWVARQTGKTLNEAQTRCVRTLCSVAAPYNLGVNWHKVLWVRDGLEVRVPQEISSWDYWGFARLMFASFDHSVRVSISGARGGNRPALKIWLHARDEREGSSMVRIPTAEQMLAMWRALSPPDGQYNVVNAGVPATAQAWRRGEEDDGDWEYDFNRVYVIGQHPTSPDYSITVNYDNGIIAMWPTKWLVPISIGEL